MMTSSTIAPMYLRQDSGISACLVNNKYIWYENKDNKNLI